MIFDFISDNLPRLKRGFSAIKKIMFTLTDTFIRSEKERVGFMEGFKWTREAAINYGFYSQFWYGQRQDKEPVFRALHKSIQATRGFAEHKCLQTFVFICHLFEVLDLIFLIGSIVQLFMSEQPQYIFLLISTIILIAIEALSRAGPLADACGKSLLRKKIIKSIQDCNIEYLNPMGYSAEFPEVTKRFCLCIRCCDCLFRKKLIDRIDIYQRQQEI